MAPRRSRPLHDLLAEARGRDRERVDGVGDPVVSEDAHPRPGGRAHPGPGDPRALVGARCQIGGAQRRDAFPRHLVVEPLGRRVDHDLGRIAALDQLTATACAPRAFGWIQQGLDDGGGQGVRLLRRDEPARLARPDDVGCAADGGGHDRALECERLECRERQPFASRGKYHQVRCGQIRSRVELAAREVHCIGEAELGDAGDQLVEAFPQVLEAVPGAGLVLVGGGPDTDELIARVAELGLADAVHFAGRQLNPAAYLAAADLVVLPSRREGLPLSALEALALERAVVATAVGGTPDVVRPGETGWLVPPEQPGALATAIVEALLDPAECARRARRGRELVERSYSTEVMIDRIERLYDEVAGKRVPTLRPAYLAARSYQRARIARARMRPAAWSGVRILGYHRVATAVDSLSVSPARFREQMRAVAESGAEPIRLDRAIELLRSPVPGRYVCVTFDDGYRDNLLAAAPVLARARHPGDDLRAEPDHRR